MKIWLIVCSFIVAFVGYAYNFNSDIHPDIRDSYIYQTLNETFDIEALSEGNPYILYAGGHGSFPWIMVVCENEGFVVYSGVVNSRYAMISRFRESGDNEIFKWAFNDMIMMCPECSMTDIQDSSILSFELTYVDKNKEVIYKYNTDQTFENIACESKIKELLGYLMMNYYVGFRLQSV